MKRDSRVGHLLMKGLSSARRPAARAKPKHCARKNAPPLEADGVVFCTHIGDDETKNTKTRILVESKEAPLADALFFALRKMPHTLS